MSGMRGRFYAMVKSGSLLSRGPRSTKGWTLVTNSHLDAATYGNILKPSICVI